MAELVPDFEETVSNFFLDSLGYVEINPFSLLCCNMLWEYFFTG